MSTEPESLDLNVSVEDELNTLMNEYLVKKEGEVIHWNANIVRDAASHIGIETLVAILVGVRSGIEEIVRITLAFE